MTNENIAHNFYSIWRPEGVWRQLGGQFSIAGVHYRKRHARKFLHEAIKSYNKDLPHGLRIEPEPTNKYDKHALRVIGYWTTKRLFFKEKEHEKFIGYVPKSIALQYAYFSGKSASAKHLRGLPPIPIALDLQFGKTRGQYIDIFANIICPGKKSGFWKDREAPF